MARRKKNANPPQGVARKPLQGSADAAPCKFAPTPKSSPQSLRPAAPTRGSAASAWGLPPTHLREFEHYLELKVYFFFLFFKETRKKTLFLLELTK